MPSRSKAGARTKVWNLYAGGGGGGGGGHTQMQVIALYDDNPVTLMNLDIILQRIFEIVIK